MAKEHLLFLSANPTETSDIQGTKEFEQIRETLNDKVFKTTPYHNLRFDQLGNIFLKDAKGVTFLHLSAHGEKEDIDGEHLLLLEDDEGDPDPISMDHLGPLLNIYCEGHPLTCIFFNVCYSSYILEHLATISNYLIGVDAKVKTPFAIHFSQTFYQTLNYGRTIPESFNIAQLTVQSQGLPLDKFILVDNTSSSNYNSVRELILSQTTAIENKIGEANLIEALELLNTTLIEAISLKENNDPQKSLLENFRNTVLSYKAKVIRINKGEMAEALKLPLLERADSQVLTLLGALKGSLDFDRVKVLIILNEKYRGKDTPDYIKKIHAIMGSNEQQIPPPTMEEGSVLLTYSVPLHQVGQFIDLFRAQIFSPHFVRAEILDFDLWKDYLSIERDANYKFNFQGLNLSGIHFQDIDFQDTNFRACNLQNATFKTINLSQSCFDGANLTAATFEDVVTNQTSFFAANLQAASFLEANLSNILHLNKANLKQCTFNQVNLSKVNLFGALLEGATFIKSNLTYANLNHANLSHAQLIDSQLNHAQLNHATLYSAEIEKVDFRDAILNKANLKAVQLSAAQFINTKLEKADLSHAHIKAIEFHNSYFRQAILNKITLENSTLERADLFEAQLEHANLEGSSLFCADLEGANLTRANLKGANLAKVILNKANLTETNFKAANLAQALFIEATLNKTNLALANLFDANFTKATLSNVNFFSANLFKATFSEATIDKENQVEGTPILERDSSDLKELYNKNINNLDNIENNFSITFFREVTYIRKYIQHIIDEHIYLALEQTNPRNLWELDGLHLQFIHQTLIDQKFIKKDTVHKKILTKLYQSFLGRDNTYSKILSFLSSESNFIPLKELVKAHLKEDSSTQMFFKNQIEFFWEDNKKNDLIEFEVNNFIKLLEDKINKFGWIPLRAIEQQHIKLSPIISKETTKDLPSFIPQNIYINYQEVDQVINDYYTHYHNSTVYSTNFVGSNLCGSSFLDVDLKTVDFTGANLSGTDLREAFYNQHTSNYYYNFEELLSSMPQDLKAGYRVEIPYTSKVIENIFSKKTPYHWNLQGVNLRGANLKGIDLAGAMLKNADLRGANLQNANLKNTNLEGANLEGANLQDAKLTGANLQNTNLLGANLAGAFLADIDKTWLMGSNLIHTNIREWDLYHSHHRGAYAPYRLF